MGIAKTLLLYLTINHAAYITYPGTAVINSTHENSEKKEKSSVTVFEYKKKHTSAEIRNIEAFIRKLKTSNPKNSSFIDSIFSHSDFKLDYGVDSIITGKKKSSIKTYSDYLNAYKKRGVLEKAPVFMDRNKIPLNLAYSRHGVDPRLIVGHYGAETIYGESTGNHTLPNTLATLYAKGSKKKKKFALEQFNAAIKYARIKGIDADSLHNIPCSYAGAVGYGQFIPTSLLSLFRGTSGDLKNSNPFNEHDAIFAIGNFLKNNGYRNWKPELNGKSFKTIKGNRQSSFAYNRSEWYNKLIWEEIVPTMPYRTINEFRDYTFSDYDYTLFLELKPKDLEIMPHIKK